MYSVTTGMVVVCTYEISSQRERRDERTNGDTHSQMKVLMQTTITDGFAEFCLTGKPMVSS